MQYALDSVQYAEDIARLLHCKVNGNLFRYIISINTELNDLRKNIGLRKSEVYVKKSVLKALKSKWSVACIVYHAPI